MENQNEELQLIFGSLDSLLGNTNLEDVTSESGAGFGDLPEGYYLSEVEKAEIKISKTSKQPMIAFQFKVVENGKFVDSEGDLSEIKNSKNRKIFMYYSLKDESSIKRFVSDMLKFEGEEKNKPILEKEYFTNSTLLADALDILIGMRIYIHLSVNENGEPGSMWKNLVSWKRAEVLELN